MGTLTSENELLIFILRVYDISHLYIYLLLPIIFFSSTSSFFCPVMMCCPKTWASLCGCTKREGTCNHQPTAPLPPSPPAHMWYLGTTPLMIYLSINNLFENHKMTIIDDTDKSCTCNACDCSSIFLLLFFFTSYFYYLLFRLFYLLLI